MKFLVDANMSHQWIGWLALAGFESVHWSSLGAGDAPDSMILEYARDHSFVILTLDLDFGIDLANTHSGQPSVVQVRCHFAHSEEIRDHVTRVCEKLRKSWNRALSLRSTQIAFASGLFPSGRPQF